MTELDERTRLAIEEDDRALRCSSVQPRTVLGSILWRSAAEEGGMSALAREIGISRTMLYELVHGTHVPSRHCARAVADYLAGRNRRVDEISVELIVRLAEERDDVNATANASEEDCSVADT